MMPALAGIPLLLLQAPAAAPSALVIDHGGVNCLVAGRFPVLEARFEPRGEVARARVYFRARGTPAWYAVEMTPEGAGHRAVLPAPRSETAGVDYYVEALDRRFGGSRTDEHSPDVVRGTCDRRLAAPFLASARVVVSAPSGAPPLPPGFSPQGVASAAGAGGAGGAGAAAGGVGVKAVVLGGVLAAGATAGVVAASGGSGESGTPATERDDDGDGVSEAQGDCNDGDRNVRPDGGFSYRAEFPWQGALHCARPPQGAERHLVKNNSCAPLVIRRFTQLHAVEPVVCFSGSGPVTIDMGPVSPVPPGAEATIATTPTRAFASCCNVMPCAEWGARRLPWGGGCLHKFRWTLETSAGIQTLDQSWSYEVLDCPICP